MKVAVCTHPASGPDDGSIFWLIYELGAVEGWSGLVTGPAVTEAVSSSVYGWSVPIVAKLELYLYGFTYYQLNKLCLTADHPCALVHQQGMVHLSPLASSNQRIDYNGSEGSRLYAYLKILAAVIWFVGCYHLIYRGWWNMKLGADDWRGWLAIVSGCVGLGAGFIILCG